MFKFLRALEWMWFSVDHWFVAMVAFWPIYLVFFCDSAVYAGKSTSVLSSIEAVVTRCMSTTLRS